MAASPSPGRRKLFLGGGALMLAPGAPLFASSRAAARTRPADLQPARLGRTIRVGASAGAAAIAEAARAARDGDTVEVEAGTYRADVAVWTQRALTIRAAGGRARLIADGAHAEGKAIWVFRNGDYTVEGFDFVGARVPDGNGAGIRFERGRLTVRDSSFIDNQMGLLTGNDAGSELTIERCEFRGPQDGDRWYHNLYVGSIDRLVLRNSWSHGARAGHLVKSRARNNLVIGNRLADGRGGNASYELEFPNGGIAQVLDNLIEQSPRTSNPAIVSFGAEGYRWPVNELAMSGNTVVNRWHGAAVFVRAARGDARARLAGNRWVGRGRVDLPIAFTDEDSRVVSLDDYDARTPGIGGSIAR